MFLRGLALTIAFVAAPAYATGTTPLARPIPPAATKSPSAADPTYWSDESKYVQCGQDCLYQKANENLSLQALYLVTKIQYLNQDLQNGDDASVKQSIHDYCRSGDSARDCFKRYLAVMVPVLRGLRSDIQKNEVSSSSLISKSPALGRQSRPEAPGLKPQVPYVPTLTDLQAQSKRMRMLTSDGYSQWLRSLPAQPALDDFVQYDTQPKDPLHPELGNVTVMRTDANGAPLHDNPAFAKAQAAWVSEVRAYRQDFAGMASTPISKADLDARQKVDPATLPDEDKAAFQSARGEVVKTANFAIEKAHLEVSPTVTFGPQRAASGSKAKAPLNGQQFYQSSVTAPGSSARSPAQTASNAAGEPRVDDVAPQKDKESMQTVIYRPADLSTAIDKIEKMPR